MLTAFALGFALAFAGSVPMTGPLALLVIDRIIAGQKASAFWIALAGAIVEGAVAFLVATFLPRLLVSTDSLVILFQITGAFLIFGAGVLLLVRPSILESIKTERREHSLLAGFVITAFNPTLFATWTVTVTALSSSGAISGGQRTGLAFGTGVATGALGWALVMLSVSRFGPLRQLALSRRLVGRAIGALLAVVGSALFVRTVWL